MMFRKGRIVNPLSWRRVVLGLTVVAAVPPLSAAIATAAAPPLQEEEFWAELLRNYGLATVLLLIGVVFVIRYWWPQHVQEREREQTRADAESVGRIEQEKAQTTALVEISAALQNVQRLQAQEAANVARISQAIEESAVSARVSADVLANQLVYLQDLNRYFVERREEKKK